MARQTTLNTKLTNNFTLYEMLKSVVADEYNLQEQYNPDEEVITRLKELCENVLQPVRDELGFPLTITSGYRCTKLNELVKGAKNSDHLYGMAADIKCHDNQKLFEAIKKYKFKQLINEYNYSWIHVSFDRDNNNCQILYIP